jgi:hypothetical protein
LESTIELLRLLEFQTFDSVWYWMAVMVTYAVASNWLLGVPFDMLFRARKLDKPHLADLETLVDVNVRRIVEINAYLGVAITIMVAFSLSVLVVLGIFYGVELAQGLLALTAPLTLIMVMNMRLAHQLEAAPLQGRELVDRLFRVRLWTQVVSMIALFLTSMYGMYAVISSQRFF